MVCQCGPLVKLGIILVIFLIYFCTELVVSHISHSITLLTDSYHSLYSILTLIGYAISVKMTNERSLRATFGYARVEILSRLISILILSALCFSVLVEALQTIIHHSHSDEMHEAETVLAIAAVGLVLKGYCFVWIGGFAPTQQGFVNVRINSIEVNITVPAKASFERNERASCLGCNNEDHNEPKNGSKEENNETEEKIRRHVLLDFIRDITCCLMTLICACIVRFYEGTVALFADPIFSIVSVIVLLATTLPLVKESGMILLQTVPMHIDVETLKNNLMKTFPSILNVHDLHIWRLTRNKVIATVHILFMSPAIYSPIAYEVNQFFLQQGIHLATIQPEFLKHEGALTEGNNCVLRCTNKQCEPRMCCVDGAKPNSIISNFHSHSHSHSHSHPHSHSHSQPHNHSHGHFHGKTIDHVIVKGDRIKNPECSSETICENHNNSHEISEKEKEITMQMITTV